MSDSVTSCIKAESLDGKCVRGKNKGKKHVFKEGAYKVWTCKYCKEVRYT